MEQRDSKKRNAWVLLAMLVGLALVAVVTMQNGKFGAKQHMDAHLAVEANADKPPPLKLENLVTFDEDMQEVSKELMEKQSGLADSEILMDSPVGGDDQASEEDEHDEGEEGETQVLVDEKLDGEQEAKDDDLDKDLVDPDAAHLDYLTDAEADEKFGVLEDEAEQAKEDEGVAPDRYYRRRCFRHRRCYRIRCGRRRVCHKKCYRGRRVCRRYRACYGRYRRRCRWRTRCWNVRRVCRPHCRYVAKFCARCRVMTRCVGGRPSHVRCYNRYCVRRRCLRRCVKGPLKCRVYRRCYRRCVGTCGRRRCGIHCANYRRCRRFNKCFIHKCFARRVVCGRACRRVPKKKAVAGKVVHKAKINEATGRKKKHVDNELSEMNV